jgi:hypothetical protein
MVVLYLGKSRRSKNLGKRIVVTLTPEERDRYEELLEKIELAQSPSEVKIYHRQALRIIEEAQKRKGEVEVG